MFEVNRLNVGIVGLGYVGLPLAVEFGKILPTVGFDINQRRVRDLLNGHDETMEVEASDLNAADSLTFTSSLDDISQCNVYIISVPTPIDSHKRPNLNPLLSASRLIGKVLQPGDIVIYESTVYPGATEEDCVPVLEDISGLKFNKDFFCGYSPERINPGDKDRGIRDITKITSGSTPEAADFVNNLYKLIITRGTHLVSSIKVAEAAKVIENTQRDLNIALINEFASLFHKLNIDTGEVLKAAGTKWNFLPFQPGLVGGHCIGVDPYYLTHKAQEVGFYPELILAGRRINEGMPAFSASLLVKRLSRVVDSLRDAKVLVLGVSFKEDCPDVRNSLVFALMDELESYGLEVFAHDPVVDSKVVASEYGVQIVTELSAGDAGFSAIMLAVPHKQYLLLGPDYIKENYMAEGGIFFDLKSAFDPLHSDLRL